MEILLSGITKSFGPETVFSNVDLVLAAGSRTAILGGNGSGKSTLLQVIGGILAPTGGTITHRLAGRKVEPDNLYRHVSLAAPYMGLYEDLDLGTLVDLHRRFKPLRGGIGPVELAGTALLGHARHKPVSAFSSGMKQRLKLALAILSDTPLLLLDEPASNLDGDGVAWFRALLGVHAEGRTVLVASNRHPAEQDLCGDRIEVEGFKPVGR